MTSIIPNSQLPTPNTLSSRRIALAVGNWRLGIDLLPWGRTVTTLALLVIAASTTEAQQLPDGPGKAELQKVCGLCHQAERSAAVRLTREGWEGVIADMIARGARGTDEEFTAVLDYLSKHFLGEAARPLNINKANNVELESVAGLTRREAAAVLKWREEVGVCKSLDDLKKVPGLDFKKIAERKDYLVCFEAVPAPPAKKDPEKKDK
jgi:competence protein ComEA